MNDRVPSGIPGLDALIGGGFPVNSVNLVCGPSGSAKTTFAMQFIYNGAKNHNDPGIYISLEEGRDNVIRAMKNYGLEIENSEKENKLFLLDLSEIRRQVGAGTEEALLVGFQALEKILGTFIDRVGAKRLAIDSVTAIGLFYGDSSEHLRSEMFRFVKFLKDKKITTVLVTESKEAAHKTRYGIEEFLADSFITLELEDVKGGLRRSINVRKMRFTKHNTDKHPLLIGDKGIDISPESKVF
ncbi:MAG: ATPase domain-containing protein [Candidatus Thermoplasmatota archaeon]